MELIWHNGHIEIKVHITPRMSCRCVLAEGRIGTCFCSDSTPYFTPSKNRDNSSGLLNPDVMPISIVPIPFLFV